MVKRLYCDSSGAKIAKKMIKANIDEGKMNF